MTDHLKHYRIGYTQGTFDLLHVGHLNLLEHAKEQCDVLLVGVNSDGLVEAYKSKQAIIGQDDRCRMVKALACVDDAFVVDTLDKVEAVKGHPFQAIFIGNDWEGNSRWRETEKQLKPYGAEVVYLPYTAGVSSSLIRSRFDQQEDRKN